jgi:hypothetical protein
MKIDILSDSETSVKELDNYQLDSKLLWECQQSQMKLAWQGIDEMGIRMSGNWREWKHWLTGKEKAKVIKYTFLKAFWGMLYFNSFSCFLHTVIFFFFQF